MSLTKPKRRVSTSTIAIITLSILLAAAIGIGITLAYFTATTNVAGTITLGDPVTISITQGGASASSLTFAGDALPGTQYTQPIGVQAPATMTEALMRANGDAATQEQVESLIDRRKTDAKKFISSEQYKVLPPIVKLQ